MAAELILKYAVLPSGESGKSLLVWAPDGLECVNSMFLCLCLCLCLFSQMNIYQTISIKTTWKHFYLLIFLQFIPQEPHKTA